MESEISRNWAELPSELLVKIIENEKEKHMLSVDDYVALCSVCRPWRRALSSSGCDMGRLRRIWGRQIPWLTLTHNQQQKILPNEEEEEEDSRIIHYGNDIYYDEVGLRKWSMLTLRYKKKYEITSPLQGYRIKYWGSGHGWILISDDWDHNMYVLNPLTKARLDLPPTSTIPRLGEGSFDDRRMMTPPAIHKLPNSTLLVALIYDFDFVAFAKPGDLEWKKIESPSTRPPMSFSGVIYQVGRGGGAGGGRIYVVDLFGDVGYCDLVEGHQQPDEPGDLRLTWYGCEVLDVDDQAFREYLVESGDDLLMVTKLVEFEHGTTVCFTVHKFVFDDKRWEQVHDLQDVALFVGDNNAAISVCATDAGCQSNCIYFTDYFSTKDRMGVFRMDDKTITPLDLGVNTSLVPNSYCCPFWFCPTL